MNIKPPRHRFGFSLDWGWQYTQLRMIDGLLGKSINHMGIKNFIKVVPNHMGFLSMYLRIPMLCVMKSHIQRTIFIRSNNDLIAVNICRFIITTFF